VSTKLKRLSKIVLLSLTAGWGAFTFLMTIQGEPISTAWMPIRNCRLNTHIERYEMHAQEWARCICLETTDPKARALAAERVTCDHVFYTNSSLVNGIEKVPTVAEVLQAGSGNCVARAIVCASLCQAIGLDAKIHSQADHAWVVVSLPNEKLTLLPL
jgi:hypothetical protein